MTRVVGFFAVVCVTFNALGIRRLEAQPPAFEVASIKPSQDVMPMIIAPELRHGRLTGARVSLRMLLAAAYGVTEPRIVGPEWLGKSRFDVIAKSPEGVPDSDLKPMLQSLLKERFKLMAHRELKEMPVYFLGVAKGGVKMPKYPAPDGAPNDFTGSKYLGFPMMRGTATTSQLAQNMSRVLDRHVVDKTGLTDRYSYFLSFAPLTPQANRNVPEFRPPDIFTAVQEQLGLKLQAGRDKVEVVVVDHIERMPTEN